MGLLSTSRSKDVRSDSLSRRESRFIDVGGAISRKIEQKDRQGNPDDPLTPIRSDLESAQVGAMTDESPQNPESFRDMFHVKNH